MRLFIAEKPSLGRAIAAGLGKQKAGNGFIACGNKDIVTWCFGHIMEQYMPEEYDEKYHVWKMEDLPIIPKQWKLKVKKDCAAQYKIIKKLVNDADIVVNAGDPDREGQLLVDEVLGTLGILDKPDKKVYRILLNALDEKSVKEALNNLHDNKKFTGLRLAALARQRGDWIIGINLTRIYTLKGKEAGYSVLISSGRVQSVVLSLVVRRHNEIKNFVPHDFYKLQVKWNHANGSFFTNWKYGNDLDDLDEEGRLLNSDPAKSVLEKTKGCTGKIAALEQKSGTTSPRLPYSLSQLQIEAGKKYGYSPQKVLDTQQELYEMKLTSYPRSDCDYLPENQITDSPIILKNLSSINSDIQSYVEGADVKLKSKAWNDKEITAHHAIIPTTVKADMSRLNEVQRNLYIMIANIAQFYPAERFLTTKVAVLCNDNLFTASGKVVTHPGWRILYKDFDEENTDKDSDNQKIPALKQGDTVTFEDGNILSAKTKPPSKFTPATLLKAMKNIDKYVRDIKLKQELKDCSGIGTEATRASIIDELQSRNYMKLSGKYLDPTELGMIAYNLFSDDIKYPDITARWENALRLIEQNQLSLADFSNQQALYSKTLIKEAIDKKVTPAKNIPLCPKCKKKPLIKRKGKTGKYFWGCSGYPECKTIFPDLKGKPDLKYSPKK